MQRIKLKKEPRLDKKCKAFSFQREALKAICDLEYAAIFHEQGLGKSKIAIDLFLYWLENKIVDTVLVVAKKGLVHNWIKEFDAHTFIMHHDLNIIASNSPCTRKLEDYTINIINYYMVHTNSTIYICMNTKILIFLLKNVNIED